LHFARNRIKDECVENYTCAYLHKSQIYDAEHNLQWVRTLIVQHHVHLYVKNGNIYPYWSQTINHRKTTLFQFPYLICLTIEPKMMSINFDSFLIVEWVSIMMCEKTKAYMISLKKEQYIIDLYVHLIATREFYVSIKLL